jgi:hypothetical protein
MQRSIRVGDLVWFTLGRAFNGRVMKRGRDAAGIYLMVRYVPDPWRQAEVKLHPSMVHLWPDFPCCGGNDTPPPDHTQDCETRKTQGK